MDTFELESIFVKSSCTLALYSQTKFFWILHLWKYGFPLVLKTFIDQSQFPTSLCAIKSQHFSFCQSRFPFPSVQERVPQTAGMYSHFQILYFHTRCQKQGEGQNVLRLRQEGERLYFTKEHIMSSTQGKKGDEASAAAGKSLGLNETGNLMESFSS